MTGVAYWTTGCQIVMGIRPVGPIRGGFAPGGVKVTLHAPGAKIVAVGTVKRAAAVKIRGHLVKPGLSRYMHTWVVLKSMAVMTGRRPSTIAAAQRMTGVTHRSIRFKLIMGSSPMVPVGRCFAA